MFNSLFISDSVTIMIKSTTGDSYYLGQPLKMSCKTSHISVGFNSVKISVGNLSILCNRYLQSPEWYNYLSLNRIKGNSEDFNKVRPLSVDCNLPENENTMTANINITREIPSGNITCRICNFTACVSAANTVRILQKYGRTAKSV